MTKALDAVTDGTKSSAVAMTGPQTFHIYGLTGDARLRVQAKATGGGMPEQPVLYEEARMDNSRQFTLEFYNTDLYFYVENNNGTVTVEY